MSQAGWEEHLRSFITAAQAGENEELLKNVLWIHVPDWTKNGVVNDIKNVTNRVTERQPLWDSFNLIDSQYDRMFV